MAITALRPQYACDRAVVAPIVALAMVAFLAICLGIEVDATQSATIPEINTALSSELKGAVTDADELLRRETSQLLINNEGRQTPSVRAAFLNDVAKQVQDALGDKLKSPEWSAMRDYVVIRFPNPPPPDTVEPAFNIPRVSAVTATNYFETIRAFINGVKTLHSLTVDLVINTNPTDADARLKTVALLLPINRTNAVIKGVFRGLYLYQIEKPGYQPIRDVLDLVNDDRSVLECVMATETARLEQSSCRRR